MVAGRKAVVHSNRKRAKKEDRQLGVSGKAKSLKKEFICSWDRGIYRKWATMTLRRLSRRAGKRDTRLG